MVFNGLATKSVLGFPQRASPEKTGLNQIMQSLNPLLWHGSWAVSVAGCVVLLSSAYVKVSPEASRREDDSFSIGHFAWAALGDVWLSENGPVVEEQAGTQRSGWLCEGDVASASRPIYLSILLISPMLLDRSDACTYWCIWCCESL